MPTIHLLIKGKVQGVFYRATAKETADQKGVTGWIRNTADGHVEAVVSGSEDQLKSFVAWCKVGTPTSKVTEVVVAKQEDAFFKDFDVIR